MNRPTSVMKEQNVAVIGGGVCGLGIGWRWAQAGCDVHIFDRGEAGKGASWAAAGMLAARAEAEPGEEALLALNKRAQEIWPAFTQDLETATGQSIGYRDEGTLIVAPNRDDAEQLRFTYEYQTSQGLDVEWLTPRQVSRKEPYLAPGLTAGVYSPSDHQVDNRALTLALKAAFLAAGGQLHENTTVDAIETAGGRRDEADFVIAATGVLHHPQYPDIEGLESFEGPCLHSARWGRGVEVAGRRVGVVGTGSSGVQIVSALIDEAEKLTLFQRTAQWIMPQENPAYSEEEKRDFRLHPERVRELRDDLARTFADNFSSAVIDADSPQMKMVEDLCRANLENSVTDPELRERLRPDYRAACKRLVISPDFYKAIQRPNAELVCESISRVEPAGVRTQDGRLHELDVLVLATGFRVDRFMRPIEVVGLGGRRLDDVWAERPSAYLSISVPGFPNFFMLNGPNGPVGNFSLIDVAELQFAYIRQLIDLVESGRCRSVSASARAAEKFERERVEAARSTIWVTGCRSWYLDDRGIPAAWPWSFDRFREEMAAPDLSACELTA